MNEVWCIFAFNQFQEYVSNTHAPCIDSVALIFETVLGGHSLLVHYQLN